LLLSVLAVLAFACSPAPAHAEEATGPVYETEVPTVPQEQSPGGTGGGHHNGSGGGGNGGNANVSNSPGEQGSGGGNNPGAGSGGSHKGQSNQASEGNTGNPGSGTGDAKNGKAGLGESRQVKPGVNASSTEDESSSPLVPILIAIAVLAAISIGAFYYRQRRQGAGSSVSPKAS
jgi:cobalamin biosynthesis Mg chelatase CobN